MLTEKQKVEEIICSFHKALYTASTTEINTSYLEDINIRESRTNIASFWKGIYNWKRYI